MFERIEFVPFRPRDTRTLWEIRNHESVRRYMSNAAPIDYASHEAWVRLHLLEEKTDNVYFVRLNSAVRGFVLIRDRVGRRAEFGIMLAPEAPRGLGAISTVLFLDHAFGAMDIDELIAKIGRHNANSIGGALGLGAQEVHPGDSHYRFFRFDRDKCRSETRFNRLLTRFGPGCKFRFPAVDAGDS